MPKKPGCTFFKSKDGENTRMILGPVMFRWRRVLLFRVPTFLVRGMAKRVKERVRCIPQARNTPGSRRPGVIHRLLFLKTEGADGRGRSRPPGTANGKLA